MQNTLNLIASSVMLAFGAVSLPSFANEQVSDKGNEEVEKIIVYGELIDRTLQDTQTSVSVITGDELNQSVDKDIFDVIDRIPGVNAEGGGFGFVIRGIAPGGVGGGSAPTVNVQIDGATVPTGQATRTASLSTWDLEQVEVLRGPQSTQQGPSSLAGAIIINSKNPNLDENEVLFRTDLGSLNERRLAGVVNVPIDDSWAIRLTAEDYETDGDIINVFTGEDSAAEFLKTYRGKVRFQPNEKFDAVLAYTRSENKFSDQGIDETRFPEERVSTDTALTIGDTDTLTLNLDYNIDDRWSISSETARLKSDYELDIPFVEKNPASTPGNRTVDDTSLTQELKLFYQSDNINAVLGVYYSKLEQDLDFAARIGDVRPFFASVLPPPVLASLPPIAAVFANTFDTETENLAVFGELEYDFSSTWTFIAGLRYDNEEDSGITTNNNSFTPDPFGFSVSTDPVSLDSEYSAFLPKFAAIYNFSEDVSLSLTAQRAYRAGGAASDFLGQPYEFDPEFTNNFELAFRSVLNDEGVTFNANLYFTDYTDMQVSQPGPSGTFVDSTIQNAGAATLWGIEVQSDFKVNDNVELFANIGYANTEFDEYVIVENGEPVDLTGNRFSQAPEWTGSIGAEFSAENGTFGDISANYTDASFYTTRNLPGELNSPFTLVNARFGYESDRWWTVYIYARNLFDKQYLSRKRVDTSSTAGDSRVIGISVLGTF